MYYFIVNPNSRSGAGREIWRRILVVLNSKRIPYKVRFTSHVGHACILARDISLGGTEDRPVRIIGVGGDGTIHEILSGIQDLSSVIFGFIPTGSGNDFCRGMGIPEDPMKALQVVLGGGTVKHMDVPYVKSRSHNSRFGISTGIGYDAAVCHEVLISPAKPVFNRVGLGKLVYGFVALKQLLFTAPVSAVIRLDDGREFRYSRMYLTAVMNQKYEGGGCMFCPDASTDDGFLDIITVEDISKPRMLFSLPFAFFGKHTGFKGIHIHRCRKADISVSRASAIHIDGESGGTGRRLQAGIEPEQLKIILP